MATARSAAPAASTTPGSRACPPLRPTPAAFTSSGVRATATVRRRSSRATRRRALLAGSAGRRSTRPPSGPPVLPRHRQRRRDALCGLPGFARGPGVLARPASRQHGRGDDVRGHPRHRTSRARPTASPGPNRWSATHGATRISRTEGPPARRSSVITTTFPRHPTEHLRGLDRHPRPELVHRSEGRQPGRGLRCRRADVRVRARRHLRGRVQRAVDRRSLLLAGRSGPERVRHGGLAGSTCRGCS